MLKNSAAFTLIELMVVVAIISILSTMGVVNFSTAIKRSRNVVRQNDVIAVSKALETCYDVMGAAYLKDSSDKTCVDDEYRSEFQGTVDGVFKADIKGDKDCQNRCLNTDIVPAINDHPYTATVKDDGNHVQKYIICAKLEKVGNWESIGNSKDDLTGETIESALGKLADKNLHGCTSDSCYFCVAAQQ